MNWCLPASSATRSAVASAAPDLARGPTLGELWTELGERGLRGLRRGDCGAGKGSRVACRPLLPCHAQDAVTGLQYKALTTRGCATAELPATARPLSAPEGDP